MFYVIVSSYWDDPDETYGTAEAHDVTSSNEDEEQDPITDNLDRLDSDDEPQEFRLADEQWSCPEGRIWNEGHCRGMLPLSSIRCSLTVILLCL